MAEGPGAAGGVGVEGNDRTLAGKGNGGLVGGSVAETGGGAGS
jgi:hypothetical protein